MACPRPEPTVLKLLKGSPGCRPINTKDPSLRLKAQIPQMPGNLRDRQARDEWKRITKLLDGTGILTRIDQKSLQLWCDTWSLYREAMLDISKNGTYMLLDNGYPAQNPSVGIMTSARQSLMKLLLEFGLTPASRVKIVALLEDEPKGLAAFGEE